MSSPTPGSTLPSDSAKFVWVAGSGTSAYWLYVGTTPGGRDIYTQSQGSSLQATVSGLPTDGSSVYVRLWSRVSGAWQYADYSYTSVCYACGGDGGDTSTEMISPAPGSTLPSSTVTFQWKAGPEASQYWLYVGTTQGGSDIYNASEGTNLAATVGSLPTNGGAVYVRLLSLVDGSWEYIDYRYSACSACGNGGSRSRSRRYRHL